MAYLSDCSGVPDAIAREIAGVDTLIIDALREKPHPTHLSVARRSRWRHASSRGELFSPTSATNCRNLLRKSRLPAYPHGLRRVEAEASDGDLSFYNSLLRSCLKAVDLRRRSASPNNLPAPEQSSFSNASCSRCENRSRILRRKTLRNRPSRTVVELELPDRGRISHQQAVPPRNADDIIKLRLEDAIPSEVIRLNRVALSILTRRVLRRT